MELKHEVKSSVKDGELIEKRRDQIIEGAVRLFKEKGFHRSTTREIAKAAGFSIGTLYEYIRTKEDVLYLVCDTIYDQVQSRLSGIADEEATIDGLKRAIDVYYRLVDDLNDEFVVMYQESKSLPPKALEYVLEKERTMTGLFETLVRACADAGELRISGPAIPLAAHHIVIQGQMWAFRRWAVQKLYTLDEYIGFQTEQLLNGLVKPAGE
ncbi:TetR family transcriptional regulator [Sporosarcina sp. NCCP-2716]|uniref:TetR/AcrR family transcriptional regulator n=1 Tax=Sporosarcina sp. NCCP-2716 TaxID=2943679 RepID=UPI002040BB9C|nr:TetR/AcrR family transcriptional regulator [Sporosarcina sp. NCCP-2716]GKV69127.1 TetR family transcriptional regulator [Sporosarcina sp. NCCP-2716]